MSNAFCVGGGHQQDLLHTHLFYRVASPDRIVRRHRLFAAGHADAGPRLQRTLCPLSLGVFHPTLEGLELERGKPPKH